MPDPCTGCGFNTDDGLYPAFGTPDACHPDCLTCDENGIAVERVVPYYRARLTRLQTAAPDSGAGSFEIRTSPGAFDTITTEVDTGSALGVWTVDADGAVRPLCPGAYRVTLNVLFDLTPGTSSSDTRLRGYRCWIDQGGVRIPEDQIRIPAAQSTFVQDPLRRSLSSYLVLSASGAAVRWVAVEFYRNENVLMEMNMTMFVEIAYLGAS